MSRALLVIDLQNDYFPGGKYPLWNTEKTLLQVENAIEMARKCGVLIIHIQHIADSSQGIAPFFNEGSRGAEIHSSIITAAPEAPVVIKQFADSFHKTNLDQLLSSQNITDLYLCGMMTQNCVTHTAISKDAEKYKVTILPDCCTTIDEMIHNISLHAVSTRVDLVPSTNCF